MTCTVSLSIPGIWLVAADTRLTLRDDLGAAIYVDESFPTSIELLSGQKFVVPTERRKIRLIGRTWFAASGDLYSTQLAFDRLSQMAADGVQNIASFWQAEREQIRMEAAEATGFSFCEIDRTVLVASGPSVGSGISCFNFSPAQQAITKPGGFVITWPPAVPESITTSAVDAFKSSAMSTLKLSGVAGIVRAAIAVIDTAREHSATVGPCVQFGLTLQGANYSSRHIYCAGRVADLAALSDCQLWEALTKSDEPVGASDK